MILLWDSLRWVCIVSGMVMVGLVAYMSHAQNIERRFDISRRYARWMIYMFACTSLGAQAERLGEPVSWRLPVNIAAVTCGLLFVHYSYRILPSSVKEKHRLLKWSRLVP